MATITNPYDTLYTNLKNRYTVELNGKSCTVAEFMLAKAGKAPARNTDLTVTHRESSAIVNVMSYVNNKLTLNVAPRRDETITRFPIRTSMSAVMSAVAACAMVVGCGIFALGSATGNTPFTADGQDNSYTEQYEENEEINEENGITLE